MITSRPVNLKKFKSSLKRKYPPKKTMTYEMLIKGNAYETSNFDNYIICVIILNTMQIKPKIIKGLKIILSIF